MSLANHELLHAAYLMCQMFEMSIMEHSACVGGIRDEAEKMNEQLGEFYQKMAQMTEDYSEGDHAEVIFNVIDTLLCNDMFDAVDAILANTNVTKLTRSLMRAYLVITDAAKDKLTCRADFYDRIIEHLESIQSDNIDRLFGHLK